MNITFVNNNKDTKCFIKPVSWAFDRIKNDTHKDVIIKARSVYGSVEYDNIKNNLPAIIFTGAFKTRTDNGLIEQSGLIVLDFDKLENVEEKKNELINDEFTFACWLSPSGKGLKALIKIPEYKDKKEFTAYFNGLNCKYPEIDPSGKNLSRLCYESFDPVIYINYSSKIWETKGEEELEYQTVKPAFPLTDDIKKLNILTKWFYSKFNIGPGNRNNSFFVLAKTFNDFGIAEEHCLSEIYHHRSADFKEDEIREIVKSGYKDKSKFGTCFFEDKEFTSVLEIDVYKGTSVADILLKFDKPKALLKKAINEIKEKSIDFWDINKNGVYSIKPFKFNQYLTENGFSKAWATNTSKEVIFVRKENNFLSDVTETEIKDFVLHKDLIHRNIGAFDFMSKNTSLFKFDFLSILPTEKIETKKDTVNECYLFYKNGVVEVSKNGYKLIDYIDIKGFIWKKQVIDRDFLESDHHEAVYRKFIWLISGKNEQRYNSLKSVIGYLLHSFKTSANNKAIILNDEVISDDPNGGSGKGLFCSAISKLKKTSSIDGKNFEFTKTFPYQTVSVDTQVLIFDDVKKRFDFESLFSLITEGITLEYKGKDAIRLNVSESPKVVITTNYTIGGASGSHERRKFEVELSSYFSSKHTPLDEFKHLLFDEWDNEEWSRFDNFMSNCVVYYLQNGLVSHEFTNLNTKRLIRETNQDFIEWVYDYQFSSDYEEVISLVEKFCKDYSFWKKNPPKSRTFKKWLTLYFKEKADFKKHPITRRDEFRLLTEDNEKAPW